MKMNRTSLMLLAAGLLTGVGGAIGMQVFAQQTPPSPPIVQSSQSASTAVPAQDAVKPDTDNIQDANGKEQTDAPEKAGVDTDNIQDPGGKEVPDATNEVADGKDHHEGTDIQDKNETEDSATETSAVGTETAAN